MKLKDGYMLMDLAGKHIAIYTGEDPNALKGTIELNDIAAFIWENLKEDKSEEELLKLILENYEVKEDEASNDLKDVIKVLNENNILENGK